MDFTSAIRLSRWVRRQGWGSWIHVSDKTASPLANICRDLSYLDLVAADWVAHEYKDDPDGLPDDTSLRFNLIELD